MSSQSVHPLPGCAARLMPALAFALALAALPAAAQAPQPIKDVDQPARLAYQYRATLVNPNTAAVTVPIPANKRFVVELIAIGGSCSSPGIQVQPLITLAYTLTGSSPALYYVAPQQLPLAPSVFIKNELTRIYSDWMSISLSVYGSSSASTNIAVLLSGYLIDKQ